MSAKLGNWLCRVGLHSWRKVFGERHWHVECRRCGRREIWRDFCGAGGYHPIEGDWERGGQR